MAIATIAVAHLETREPLFSSFEVEMWNSDESQKLTTRVIEGTLLPATRITTSGGTNILKYYFNAGGTYANGVDYRTRVVVKNNGPNTMDISSNFTGTVQQVAAGATVQYDKTFTGNGVQAIQLVFRALNDAHALDFIAHTPSIVRLDTGVELIPHNRRTFSPVETTGSGNWIAYLGAVVTPTQDQEALTSWWKQKDVTFFPGLTRGTTYKFKSRVHLRGGGHPSSWSPVVTLVAGDTDAPNPTYSPSVTVTEAGVRLDANPQSPPADTDRYEFYWNKTNTAPSSASRANAPESKAPVALLVLVLGVEDFAYVWVRAIDTSGNKQAWQFLGVFGMRQYVGQGLLSFNNTDHIKSVPLPSSPTSAPPSTGSGDSFSDVQNAITKQGFDDYVLNTGLNAV